MSNTLKTNEQILRALLRELNTIEAAILRERIIMICTITLSQIDTWKPGAAFLVDNQTYKKIIERIQSVVEFKDETKTNNNQTPKQSAS